MHKVTGRRLVIAFGIAAGVLLRIGIYGTTLGRPDSDEALTGLMVRHLGDTGFPWFVWGQSYGGTAWLLPVAASMQVFGDNLLGLRLPNLVLAAVNAWLLYRLARRSMDERWAVLAGLLLWIAPAASVWFGIHEQLFYPPTTTIGLGLLLLVAHMVEGEDGRWWHATLFGLLVGLGWWTSSNVVYFVVPAVAWGLLTSWRRLLRPSWIAAAIGAALVGALPWIVAVIEQEGAPLRATETFPRLGSFPMRMVHLFREALPGAVGGRDILSHDWSWGVVGVAVTLLVYSVCGIGLWRAAVLRSWDSVAFPWFVLVYAAIGWSPDDPNLRYTFAAAPILVTLAVRGIAWIVERGTREAPSLDRRWVRAALVTLAAATLLTTSSMVRLHQLSEDGGTVYRVGNVADLDEVVQVLDDMGISRAWGDYWVAYRLAFETGGRITSSPAAGISRYDPFATELLRTDRTDPVAWVVLRGPQEESMVAALAGLGVGYRRIDTDHFVVFVPDRPISPGELPEAARRAPETPRPTL